MMWLYLLIAAVTLLLCLIVLDAEVDDGNEDNDIG